MTMLGDWSATMTELNLSKEQLLNIASNKDPAERALLLFYKNLPEDIINILRNDKHIEVKKAFAWTYANENDLDILICDPNPQVRWRASANTSITEEQLFKLIDTDDFLVKRNIAANQNIPITVIKKLLEDENQEVANLARVNTLIYYGGQEPDNEEEDRRSSR